MIRLLAFGTLAIIALSGAPLMPTVRAALILVAVLVSALVLPVTLVVVGLLGVTGAFIADAVLGRRTPVIERRVADLLVRGLPSPMVVHAQPGTGTARVRQPRAAEVRVEPPEADESLVASVIAERRGRHDLGPVGLRVTGPLGLAAWYRTVGAPHTVSVYPDVPGARRIATAVRRGLFRSSGELTRGPLGLGNDFESVRDYIPDDDVRQINWPATQREGRPMSNQYRVEQDRIVIGLLDAGRLMAAPIGDRTRLDAALDAFVAVAFVADEVGDRCGAVAFSDRVIRTITPNRRNADHVVRALFDLQPQPVDSAYDIAFQAVGAGKRSLVMVFTDLLDEAAAAELLTALPVLVRRHVVMVVSVIDPAIDDLIRTDPTTIADVYGATAALDLLDGRARAAHLLGRRGAVVIEALPDALPETCVRAYLRAKTRARL